MLNLADVAVEYIRGIATLPNPSEKMYQDQCVLFNNTLRALQPQPRLQAAQISSPNAFFWEAQRVLLAMSAEMDRSLLVNREGFQAIRSVLSGLPKNRTEIHSSLRHATSWPPYIQPADGMDEVAEPEDSWSRAVSAGALMQEAGFSKEDQDDAVDILNGMAADGTPTIQQRTAIARERSLSSWEASIRATRNAHEAWDRFRNPPQAGLQPGVPHYAAMFEKLVLQEADAHSRLLPGDKAINFPVRQESNLTEFEKARLRPPSIAQLFERMLEEKIRPAGNCLHVLLANASSVETARRYIDHSPESHQLKWNLYRENPDPGLLKKLDVGILAGYIQALTAHGSKRSGNKMMRAIRMARLRFGTSKSPAAQTVWGTILKNLSQHHVAMKISLGLQLKLLLHAMEQMGGRDGITLRAFVQFSKGIRKIVRREIDPLAELLTENEASASMDPLLRLYEKDPAAQATSPVSTEAPGKQTTLTSTREGPETQPPDMLFRSGAARMKELFNTLKAQECESQRFFDKHRVAALDRMAWRKDLFRSDHAHEYLLALAYVGEFEEMAAVLSGLIREWSQPDVVEALVEVDEPPPHADFFEALCAFRLLAEPMVDEGVVEGLRGQITESGVGWLWPDGAAIQTYLDIQEDDSTATFARVLEWVRKKRDEHRGLEAADLDGDFDL
ncbi:hypothetical protein ESCO_002669 [Escovopsis weberi]|uniref:Prefoldin subunit 3 n=1 Tax=Escovopsis weberi TaxID=150374 RepID=A0A0M8MSC6_ESCWE|nr:hypothetical protein ESCO_002669 [Escovopsis weberi]